MGDLATLPTFQAAPTGYSHTDFNAVFAALTIANAAVSTNKLADQAVTFQKMANVATQTLLGRSTAAPGVVEAITLGAGLALAATVLSVGWLDSDASHRLRLATASNLTLDRTITVNPGDADRTVTLNGNPTLADWFNQDVKTTASPTFVTVTAALAGNASTATTLQTARLINGVSFNGSLDITVPAAAGTLTGTTLAGNVVNTSITGTGALASGSITPGFGSINVSANSITGGSISGTTGTFTGTVQGSKEFLTIGAASATTASSGRFEYAGASISRVVCVGADTLTYGQFGILVQKSDGTNYSSGLFTSTGLNNTVIGATTPAAGSFTTLNATGPISATDIISTTGVGNAIMLRVGGATTSSITGRFTNSGGDAFFGMERSAGNEYIVGSTGYDTIIRGPSGLAFSANAGSAMQMRLASTGLAVVGTTTSSDDIINSAGGADNKGFKLTSAGAHRLSLQRYDTISSGSALLSAFGAVGIEAGATLGVGTGTRTVTVSTTGLSVTGTLGASGLVSAPDLLLTGTDAYLNMDVTAGVTGYGLRNNLGTIEVKHSGGAWAAISASSATVSSVNASGGTTGLSFSGGPITTSGTLTLAGTLAVANGGTGGTTAAAARTNLGIGTMAERGAWLSTADPLSTDGANGDVWFKHAA